jgi:hypothetical protein
MKFIQYILRLSTTFLCSQNFKLFDKVRVPWYGTSYCNVMCIVQDTSVIFVLVTDYEITRVGVLSNCFTSINITVSRNKNFWSVANIVFGIVRLLDKQAVDRYLFFAAIAAIRSHPQPIASFEEVAAIRGVGTRMGEKIRELLAYNRITKVTVCCISSPARRWQPSGAWGPGWGRRSGSSLHTTGSQR